MLGGSARFWFSFSVGILIFRHQVKKHEQQQGFSLFIHALLCVCCHSKRCAFGWGYSGLLQYFQWHLSLVAPIKSRDCHPSYVTILDVYLMEFIFFMPRSFFFKPVSSRYFLGTDGPIINLSSEFR